MTKFDEFGLPEPTKYPQMPKVIKMNERIKELAEQAGFKNGTFDGYWVDDGGVGRFAYLIVRECAELMKKESEEYYNVGSDYCDHKAEAFDEAVDLVKKHFGVE